jgi:hypothetical protein
MLHSTIFLQACWRPLTSPAYALPGMNRALIDGLAVGTVYGDVCRMYCSDISPFRGTFVWGSTMNQCGIDGFWHQVIQTPYVFGGGPVVAPDNTSAPGTPANWVPVGDTAAYTAIPSKPYPIPHGSCFFDRPNAQPGNLTARACGDVLTLGWNIAKISSLDPLSVLAQLAQTQPW